MDSIETAERLGITEEQVVDLAEYDKRLRGILSSLMKTYRDADTLRLATFGATRVDPVIASLPNDATLPTISGLAGIRPLTKAQFVVMQSMVRSLMELAGKNSALIIDAIGINAGE